MFLAFAAKLDYVGGDGCSDIDSDDSNDSDSNEKRQFSNKRYYYRNYPPYLVIFFTMNLHCSIIVNLTGSFSFYA